MQYKRFKECKTEEWVEWVPNSSDMVVSSCCEPIAYMQSEYL